MKVNEKAISYELKLSAINQQSKNVAWSIAFISMLVSIGLLFTYIYHPIRDTVPYVVKVDGMGGATLLNALDSKKVDLGEALDKYFIKEYIVKRESYYYNLIEQDYLFVQLLSSSKVSEQYRGIYEGKDSRDKKLGKKGKVEVSVVSISLGVSAGIKTSTVRIKVTEKEHNKGEVISYKIVTIGYEYDTSLMLSEGDRMKNPLGFLVLDYRTDSEVSK